MIIIFQILLGLGVAGILILAFRKISVLLNYPRHPFEEISLKQKFLNKWQKIKERVNQSDSLHEKVIPHTEKTLRKLKVFILKLDNFLARIVDKLRHKTKERENGKNDDNLPE